MNWFLFPTLLLGLLAYILGRLWARRVSSPGMTLLCWFVLLLLAVPGFLYAAYYSKLLGEPIWVYRVRSTSGSELLASLAGFVAGWAQVRIVPKLRLSGLGARGLVPMVLAFVLALPYLKPILRPLRKSELRDVWIDSVCIQSSGATCGPASAATILRELGQQASERKLAEESFSSASGTENWYLTRALRRRGMTVDFRFDQSLQSPLPAIAGVRMLGAGNTGHFIALLNRQGDRLIVADPVVGRITNTLANLRSDYEFTGFMLVIHPTSR